MRSIKISPEFNKYPLYEEHLIKLGLQPWLTKNCVLIWLNDFKPLQGCDYVNELNTKLINKLEELEVTQLNF